MSKVTLGSVAPASVHPEAVRAASMIPGLDTTMVFPNLGSIDSVRQEIDDAFADMKTFLNTEPDEVIRMCGGHGARLQEIRVQIMRIEGVVRQWKAVREREVEPVIEELKNQYQIASRRGFFRELDWKIASGQT